MGSCRGVSLPVQRRLPYNLASQGRCLAPARRGAAGGCCAALARWAAGPSPPPDGEPGSLQRVHATGSFCWRAAAAASVAAALLSGLERGGVRERLGSSTTYHVAAAGAAAFGPAFDVAERLQGTASRHLPLAAAAQQQAGRMLLVVLEAALGAAEQALRFRSSLEDVAGLLAALDRTVFNPQALADCFEQAAAVLYIANAWTSGGARGLGCRWIGGRRVVDLQQWLFRGCASEPQDASTETDCWSISRQAKAREGSPWYQSSARFYRHPACLALPQVAPVAGGECGAA